MDFDGRRSYHSGFQLIEAGLVNELVEAIRIMKILESVESGELLEPLDLIQIGVTWVS